jgi:glycosyltransferase involved in cell wall biosynthesis
MVELQDSRPLVSVIITCYNHGKYLAAAIESVLLQTYTKYELIIIDDGSTDDTAEVCLRYPFLRYVYQLNSGLSAARNAGIKESKGKFLVFLDADDWLLVDALKINLNYLSLYNEHAFVSGAFLEFHEPSNQYKTVQRPVLNNHYRHLLEGNYIGMHAAVMYQRWVFDILTFDPAKRYCEDYDLYLRICRQFQVVHHTHVLAVYRQHGDNMSRNYSGMIEGVIKVLMSQKEAITTKEENDSLDLGIKNWKAYYSEKLFNSLKSSLYNDDQNFKRNDMHSLKAINRTLYNKVYLASSQPFLAFVLRGLKSLIKRAITRYTKAVPAIGKVNLGHLNRTTPFSTQFGYDRGGPVDRYFIEKFLVANASNILGRVLEIGDNEYTMKYGQLRVSKSEVLHIDSSNLKATIIGDLTNVPQLADESFDCIILTQTLQLIYNYKDAIATCFRILKPGGTLLITVPGISQIASDQWADNWCWSFTSFSITKSLQEFFAHDQVKVESFGNVLLATGFLYGMGIGEMKAQELEYNDPHYQLVISAIAVK